MYGSEDRQAWLTEFLDEVGIQWVIGIHMYAYIPCGTYDYVHFGCIATYIGTYICKQIRIKFRVARVEDCHLWIRTTHPWCVSSSHPNSKTGTSLFRLRGILS